VYGETTYGNKTNDRPLNLTHIISSAFSLFGRYFSHLNIFLPERFSSQVLETCFCRLPPQAALALPVDVSIIESMVISPNLILFCLYPLYFNTFQAAQCLVYIKFNSAASLSSLRLTYLWVLS
jgi:hypothetical protein